MAGYSESPLLKKLGLKSGHSACVFHAPEKYFDWIYPLPTGVSFSDRFSGKFDFIHIFASDQKVLADVLPRAIKCLKSDAMLWVSWPKRSSGVKSDLDENILRQYGLRVGLVDVKVCAVDETWSALKFVIPVKSRV